MYYDNNNMNMNIKNTFFFDGEVIDYIVVVSAEANHLN